MIAAFPLPSAVAAAELVVGQVAPLDDPASTGNQLRQGVALCFDAINRKGGVHGATLRLVSRHRELKVEDIVPKTRALIDEAAPVALIGFLGTGPMEALLKSGVLQSSGIAVVGIRTGASNLREAKGSEWLFHTRASYATEVTRTLAHMSTIGATRLGLYFEDSSFGAEARTLVERQAAARGVALLQAQSHPNRSADPAAAVAAFMKAGVNAVLVAGNSEAAADFYKAYRAQRGAAFVVALSAADGAQVAKRIGEATAQGLAIVQVAPDPASSAMPLSRELHSLARQAGRDAPALNQGVAEGCIAAKALAEALRRAGPAPSRARVRQALEGMSAYDTGGITIGFSPGNHSGSGYVDIAILNGRGRMLR